MQNTQVDFDRIFEAWKELEAKGEDVICEEIFALEINGANAVMLSTSYIGLESFYREHIKRVIINTPNISNFFIAVKNISEEAYEFLSNGHDFTEPMEYFQFKTGIKKEENNPIFEMKNYSKYLAYAFRRIIDLKDESKKKSILKGLLGL